eukprot:jgi/Mesvir1/23474/Mv22323-RA.1
MKRWSLRTRILPIPQEFIDYLLDDGGVFMTNSADGMPTRQKIDTFGLTEDDYQDWSSDDDTAAETGDEDAEAPPKRLLSFPDLEASINEAIKELGGAVVPKLNWSCPKDAQWVTSSGTVKCTSAGEVLLMLKSSDNVTHDLCHAFEQCSDAPRATPPTSDSSPEQATNSGGVVEVSSEPPSSSSHTATSGGGDDRADSSGPAAPLVTYQLALRQWYPLRPELEFRCFVLEGRLVGICQRDVSTCYDMLLADACRNEIREAIVASFEERVLPNFPDDDYTFDVYVKSDMSAVKIIDFNPLGGSTNPLLFTWEELTMRGGPPPCHILAPTTHAQGHDRACSDNGAAACCQGDSGAHRDAAASGGAPEAVEFRVVTSQEGVILPGWKNMCGVPLDLYDMSEGSAIEQMISRLKAEERQ